MTSVAPRIEILDGGMGRELLNRMKAAHIDFEEASAWSANALRHHLDFVTSVHYDFYCAGSTIATTNTYSTTPEVARKLKIPLSTLIEAACNAAECARNKRALDGDQRRLLIVGSVPPLRYSWRPDLMAPYETMVKEYTEMISILAPRVDILLIESMSAGAEIRAALEVASQFKDMSKDEIWLAIAPNKPINNKVTLNSGQSLSSILSQIKYSRATSRERTLPKTIFLNCSPYANIGHSLSDFAALAEKYDFRMGVYPNGQMMEQLERRKRYVNDAMGDKTLWDKTLESTAFARQLSEWMRTYRRLTIVGGCCGVGPAFIHALATQLMAEGKLPKTFLTVSGLKSKL